MAAWVLPRGTAHDWQTGCTHGRLTLREAVSTRQRVGL
eukprot:COSAG01_NODE_71027_length_257_cov_0.645570_1_plen_37_part_01